MNHRIEFSDVVVHGTGREQGSLILAVLAGIASSIIAVALWITFTSIAGLSTGYAAILTSVVVGLSVRWIGGGTSGLFGLVGAVFTLLGSLAGEYFAVVLSSSTDSKFDFYGLLMQLDVASTGLGLLLHVTPVIGVIYLLALMAAYRMSYQTP